MLTSVMCWTVDIVVASSSTGRLVLWPRSNACWSRQMCAACLHGASCIVVALEMLVQISRHCKAAEPHSMCSENQGDVADLLDLVPQAILQRDPVALAGICQAPQDQVIVWVVHLLLKAAVHCDTHNLALSFSLHKHSK